MKFVSAFVILAIATVNGSVVPLAHWSSVGPSLSVSGPAVYGAHGHSGLVSAHHLESHVPAAIELVSTHGIHGHAIHAPHHYESHIPAAVEVVSAHGLHAPHHYESHIPAAVEVVSAHGLHAHSLHAPHHYESHIPAAVEVVSTHGIHGHAIHAHAPAHVAVHHGHEHSGTYVAANRGSVHVAPLSGHTSSVKSLNVEPAPGTW